MALPDNRQAVDLYEIACDLFTGDKYKIGYEEPEYEAIANEMRELIEARSDRSAGATILWWDCWDKKLTATRFARMVRERWAEQQKEIADGA